MGREYYWEDYCLAAINLAVAALVVWLAWPLLGHVARGM